MGDNGIAKGGLSFDFLLVNGKCWLQNMVMEKTKHPACFQCSEQDR